MSLPGKLCIGIIEEDNPLKSYFRFKPLLVAEGDAFLPWSQPQAYPGDGCIRIVPDKNESYHFKARMRRMGLFCVVDLREHPDENDKIRPNKNFRADGEERNAFIIYSDVVREPAADAVLALTPAEKAGEAGPAPAASALLALSDELARADIPHGVVWVDRASGALEWMEVDAVTGAERAREALLLASSARDGESVSRMFRGVHPDAHPARVVVFSPHALTDVSPLMPESAVTLALPEVPIFRLLSGQKSSAYLPQEMTVLSASEPLIWIRNLLCGIVTCSR